MTGIYNDGQMGQFFQGRNRSQVERIPILCLEGTDSALARQKLDWWRTEVNRLFAGNPTHPVTLAAIKAEPKFKEFRLVRESRLSVVPVSDEHWKLLTKMSSGK
mgnify:CR=1 FL=1